MFNSGSTSLKFFKRLNVYKNSTNTVSFNPETKQAYSYRWNFVGMLKGRLVFNDYNWSTTTSAHQSAVRDVLRELGLKPIFGDFGPNSIDSIPYKLNGLYVDLIDVQIEMERTRIGTYKRASLERELKERHANLKILAGMGFKLSVKRQREIRLERYERAHKDIEETEYLKACKFLDATQAASNLDETDL